MRTDVLACCSSLLFLVTASCARRPQNPRVLRVAAASSLSTVLDALEPTFEAESRTHLLISYGATGVLARQIEQGAPFDVFASADRETPERLEHEGRVVPGSVVAFAHGRLVIWTAANAQVRLASLGDIANPAIERIAIANPETAPFGRAAQQALTQSGLWNAVRPRLIIAENVRQAYQFAESGNADVALTAQSVVPAGAGTVLPVNGAMYAPIEETLAVVAATPSGESARAFVQFMRSGTVHATLDHYGFDSATP